MARHIEVTERKRAAVRTALEEGELSGVFDGDAFASVRAELALTRSTDNNGEQPD